MFEDGAQLSRSSGRRGSRFCSRSDALGPAPLIAGVRRLEYLGLTFRLIPYEENLYRVRLDGDSRLAFVCGNAN